MGVKPPNIQARARFVEAEHDFRGSWGHFSSLLLCCLSLVEGLGRSEIEPGFLVEGGPVLVPVFAADVVG